MSSDDSEGEKLLYQVLPVGNFNIKKFDPSMTPATAEQYLQKVM